MKSLSLTRGVALAGVLTLSHVAPALAAAAQGDYGTLLATPSGRGNAARHMAIPPAERIPLNLGHTSTAATHTSTGGGASLVRTIVGLFVVIAVIYGIAWILRQAKGRGVRASGTGLTQLANLPLGGGRSVALVRAGREVMLVGVAEHGVTPIRTYSEAEAIASGIELPDDESISLGQAEKPLDRALDALRRMTVRS